MDPEILASGKCSGAHGALVGPLSCMYAHMFLELGGADTATAASVADVWLLSAVGAVMNCEATRVRETLSAD